VALLAGCSLIPDYLRPDLPVPSWLGQAKPAADTPLWGDVAWKEVFTDPALSALIQQALDNNRDLRVAALNVEVARATYGIAFADLLPNVDAGGSTSVDRTPARLTTTSPQAALTSRKYTANLGVTSFELDLFGRLRSLNEQALEQFLASDEARTAAQISLVAEVANAWLTLLGDRKLLALTEDTLATRVKSLELIQRSFERGVSSELDLAQARTTVETARANRARYQRLVEQDRNGLAVLVGAPVDEARLAGDLDAVRLVEDVAVGLPSEVLLRRPDVARAEHQLKAANANIGAARAAFFPKITLTGAAGFASPYLGLLFDGDSGAWSYGGKLSLPIFDAGRNLNRLDAADAEKKIAVAQYEKAIQTAFREVADALSAKATLSEQMNAQAALVEAARTSTRLSQARYDRGVDSYLSVLDSQRSLYSAQQDLVSVQVARLANLVSLYKVLGGGRG
jgi:multidrug efflux system outer membrane protein